LVHISRIVLRNFKSFNGTIKLNFDKGFNVITGPNGSGKSNILDAVQFVLGELGSKRMRVPDLSGLIYDAAGQDGSKPQYSQVTIYFDNKGRGLAIDRNSISIGRRMDRLGKSKYFLNGKRTSRKQLLNLLTMAGITPGGYNIVLQGTATRLSDLTSSERMNALEDLVGLKEYDEKKSEAKVRLNEAERKIEIASAKSDEVRKRVNELERQMNDALRFNLLSNDEARLEAIKLSTQINSLETKIQEYREQLKLNNESIETIEKDRENLIHGREEAREQLEEFTKEASERGNTQLPILKSDLVGKRTLIHSIELREQEIETQKNRILRNIESKQNEIARSKIEIDEKKKNLEELNQREADINKQIDDKNEILTELSESIRTHKETAESNQMRIEQLTADLVPMQESLSGLEISINRHSLNSNSIQSKIEDLGQKSVDSQRTIKALEDKIKDFETLKVDEAARFEDMLNNIDSQIQTQKNLRNTIEGANKLAKDAELTINQFSAKRDLWKNIVTDEKAQSRITEMGEAGALDGYHGILRSLVKIDLKYQRAADTASSGWSKSIVVENIETAVQCIESLKKNRLGMTHFIPLGDINPPEPLPNIKMSGVEGYLPSLIRYDPVYDPAVRLIWGDTYVVSDKDTAVKIMKRGYRAVTLEGDLFEIKGGLIGGHWRRAPDYKKLIPSEDSIKDLSTTIKALRKRLTTRMTDLRKSGKGLRDLTEMLDHFNGNIDGINKQIKETNENIQRIKRNIDTINNNIKKFGSDKEKELNLASTLQGRKEKTLNEIERTKNEIAELRGLTPSDIKRFELNHDNVEREIGKLREHVSQIRSDISVQTSLVERYLSMKTEDIETQIANWNQQIAVLDEEKIDNEKRNNEEREQLKELEKSFDSITSEVEATSKMLERHRANVQKRDRQIERLDRNRVNIDRRAMSVNLEIEKCRLQAEQKFEELARLGYEDAVPTEEADLNQVESTLQRVRREKMSLGAINQLAVRNYELDAYNYKHLSVHINELEAERGSILNFIEMVERDKTDHFMKAFNEICENFSHIFSKISGGGDGRLELQKPENPFSGGVDLYVQFPGKPLRLAAGASGGERSVAAITYLLAIQRFLKAPFYLFDEIDAHLDDLNTTRLAEVLKDNTTNSQFLMVSLKDIMVHNADRIYGVFAQGGKSQVLTLPLKKAEVST